MQTDKKTVLIVLRHSPYGSALAKAALDVTLAHAALEQPADLLLLGDGVLQLLPGQDASYLGIKNIGRRLASLPMYDVDSVYVDAAAANRYAIDLSQSTLAIRVLQQNDIYKLMVAYDHLLGF